MRRAEIEAWVHRIIDRVRARNQREDSFADLKAAWPADHARAARQIAGLCNAARGEPALWLIGVDEDHGAVGAAAEELSEWWGKVRAGFAGQVPRMQDVAITLTDGTGIVALAFYTDAAPFVVRNPLLGKQGGGAIDREVPWREGTATRSATREELLQILVPVARLPRIEVRSMGFQWQPASKIDASLFLYVVPSGASSIAIPLHRARLSWEAAGKTGPLEPAFFSDRNSSSSPHVVITSDGVILSGPGSLWLQCLGDGPPELAGAREVRITAALHCAEPDRAVMVEAVLTPRESAPGHPAIRWAF